MLMLSCVWVCCVGILVFVIRPESSSLTPRIIITAMAIITGALVAAPQEQLAYPPTDITVSQVSLRNPKYSPAILSCVPPSGDPSFGSALVITGMYGWSQTLMPHHTMAWSSIWLSVVSLSSTPSTPSLPPTTTSSMRIIDVPSELIIASSLLAGEVQLRQRRALCIESCSTCLHQDIPTMCKQYPMDQNAFCQHDDCSGSHRWVCADAAHRFNGQGAVE
eukprot:2921242-Rhodomonas_salina.1